MGYLLLHSGQPSAKRLLKRVTECTGVESMDPVAGQDVVIRWGSVEGEDSASSWTLNPRQAIENTLSRTRMLRVLKQNGVYTPAVGSEEPWSSDGMPSEVMLDSNTSAKIVRYYRVPIFDMQPLALFRADGKEVWLNSRFSPSQEAFREIEFDEDVYATRAVRMALRALNALGLDFGLVSIGITARGRTICLHLTAAPRLVGRMLDLFADAIDAFIARDREEEAGWTKAGKNPHSFLMGADLEFMLRSRRGKLVLASDYLPRKGRVGCDDFSIRHDGKRFPLAELRPEPAGRPEELIENIRRTMLEASALITDRNVLWVAGSMPFPNFPIGGHVHYSNLPFSSRFVKVLDHYLGLPVMMIEASHTSTKRRPKYGFLGDVRFKSHGGFEYRSMGCWLVSPEISQAVLALAYVVANHYRDLRVRFFENPSKQRDFYESDKRALRRDFERVWKDIERTATYQEYRQVLQIIPDMVREGVAWNEAVDLKHTWGLQNKWAASHAETQPFLKFKRKGRDRYR